MDTVDKKFQHSMHYPPHIMGGGEKKNLLPMGSLLELKWGDKFLTEFCAFHTIMGGRISKKCAPPHYGVQI